MVRAHIGGVRCCPSAVRLGPGMGSRVELFAAIRFDWQRNGSSIRALADKYGVHRRTVRQAIESVVPPQRRSSARAAPVLNAVRGWVDEMLREDLDRKSTRLNSSHMSISYA